MLILTRFTPTRCALACRVALELELEDAARFPLGDTAVNASARNLSEGQVARPSASLTLGVTSPSATKPAALSRAGVQEE